MRAVLLALFLPLSAHAATLTFDDAYARALHARGLDAALVSPVAPPGWNRPAIRFETTAQHGESIDLRGDGLFRLGATTTILSVDVPILDRAARERRMATAATDALLFRRRALDEADQLFEQTLDAFAQLVLAERRIELLRGAAARAGELRDRARVQLTAGHIDNLTAVTWEEQALAVESQLVDLELLRVDAETRLRQLMGDVSGEAINAVADLDSVGTGFSRSDERPAEAGRYTLIERKWQLAVDEIHAQRRPQMFLTGFGGAAGGSGLFGLRVSLTLPSFDAARAAAAQLELAEASRAKGADAEQVRARADQLRLAMAGAEKRIELLGRGVELSRARAQSVARLVASGVRAESQLTSAATEVVKRESDLLGARVERWKLAQLVKRNAP